MPVKFDVAYLKKVGSKVAGSKKGVVILVLSGKEAEACGSRGFDPPPKKDDAREFSVNAGHLDEWFDVDDLSFGAPSVVGLEKHAPPGLPIRHLAASAPVGSHDAERRKALTPDAERRRRSEGACEIDVAIAERARGRRRGPNRPRFSMDSTIRAARL